MRRAVLFDVVGTLFSLEPLQRKLRGATFDAWFERLLHTATSLTLSGEFRPFADIAGSTLKTTLAKLERDMDPKPILDSLQELPPYAEAAAAFDVLERARILIGALTNSGEKQARALLAKAGLEARVVEIVSVEEIERYTPHPAVYRHATERLGVEPRRVTVITAHAWDVVGAKHAGLDAIWIDRTELEWPFPKGRPRRVAHDLVEAANLVAAKN
jgi:2-haloacid dehalogenase